MSTPDTIPRRVDFRRAALGERTFAGRLSLAELPRTKAVAVPDSAADVDVTLAFEEDGQRRVVVGGQAKTRLSMACQRCLRPADVAMDFDIAGMAVSSDEAAAQVPRDWEPMLADGDTLDLHALIDDELLLALPITVHCERTECRAAYESTEEKAGDTEGASGDDEKSNPFAALAVLRQRDDTSD